MFNHPHLLVKKRIIFLFLIIFLMIILLTARLVWIQVINSDEYQNKALDQRKIELKVEPKRGIIYDRQGRELAVSASSETVVAIPPEIDDPQRTARQLAPVLEMSFDSVYDKITQNKSQYYIKRKVKEETAQKVRNLDLKGIIFTEESKRYYPKENLASHLLGFAGIDSQGLDGLEHSYDHYLKGTPGKIETETDAAGRSMPDGGQKYIAARNGYNLHLTLDEVIQYIAERELDKAMNEFQISGGTVVVMDPRNGGILALANRPDYNPNNFFNYSQKLWRNRAISDSFEPGSAFKIITTATALEEGVVNENDRFVDPGHIIVSGERIDCWKAGGHGSQSFTEVVQNSCNPGFVQVGMRVGKESFYNYTTAFGIGSKTGIKLPGEAEGLLSDYDNIGPVELATMSFGHGVTVTPIQLVSAVSAVANKGMLVRPRLVNEIKTPEGELVKKVEPFPIRQVISEETAARTLRLLENVVAEGTGRNAGIEGYRIGGKTGTAKHYGAELYDSSFIGIIPVDNPRLVILVVLYDVTGYPYYGSQTAAPVFKRIGLDVLRYLDIAPEEYEGEEKKRAKEIAVPDILNYDLFQAKNLLKKSGLDVKVIGEDDKVVKQIPLAGAKVKEGSTVLVYTESFSGTNYYVAVPDLNGYTSQEASNLLNQLGLILVSEGDGKIYEQDIEPGTRVPGGTRINVKLKEDG
ncbi:MAG: stage V sporulation protein D [Halanaerobiales bacterium]